VPLGAPSRAVFDRQPKETSRGPQRDVRSRFNEEWSENRSEFISVGDQLGDASTGSKRGDCNINMLG